MRRKVEFSEGYELVELGRLIDLYMAKGYTIDTEYSLGSRFRFDLMVSKGDHRIFFEIIRENTPTDRPYLIELRKIALKEFPNSEFHIVVARKPSKHRIQIDYLDEYLNWLLLESFFDKVKNRYQDVIEFDSVSETEVTEMKISRDLTEFSGRAYCLFWTEVKSEDFVGKIRNEIPFNFSVSIFGKLFPLKEIHLGSPFGNVQSLKIRFPWEL